MGTAPNKLALGTVQFGLDYGISNALGQLPLPQVAAILSFCQQQHIRTLDTAAAYGQSEAVLGKLLPDYDFKVISKLAPGSTPADVASLFQQSLTRLQLPQLYGYLIHDFVTYVKQPRIWEEVVNLQHAGLVQKTGFSLYYPADLEAILKAGLSIQLVQIPFNVFDQRFAYLLPELISRNIEIHARSIFLQGLFFMPLSDLPVFFSSIKPALQVLQELALTSGIPLSALLLGFAHCQPALHQLVIGVTSVAELKDNLSYVDYLDQVKPFLNTLKGLACTNENIILPFKWNLT